MAYTKNGVTDPGTASVWMRLGCCDAACDYFNATYTMEHLQPGGEFQGRYRFARYESGHMMYLRKADLRSANDELRSFIAWALEGAKDSPRKVK